MARVVIIGAGPMGLASAWQAANDGHTVTVLEAAKEAGGMAAHFDFDGLSIERFYHFICRADQPTFRALEELGIAGKLRWAPTSMGFYFNGKLHPWGDPVSLLRLPGVSLLTKLRYGLFAFVSTRRATWPALEHQAAADWIRRWCGEEGYDKFWRPLFDYKFYQYASSVSAAWIWTRIRRIGSSRKSIMQEELGYLDGGSQTLVDALCREIMRRGGRIMLGAPALKVETCDGKVTGVHTPNEFVPADAVISTMPVQLVPSVIPDLAEDVKRKYLAIENIGICCVLFKLKRRLSPHFWINVNDRSHEIPGVIEFSNLRPVGETIVYVPYYMPLTDPKFAWSDQSLQQDALSCLQMINPELRATDIIAAYTGRLKYAQPICDVGFAAKLPPVQTQIAGLQVADTCFYYPEDRGISESIRLGREMARAV